jgi:hypothetical protein
MMFVALRKTSSSPAEFVTPMQGIYAATQKQGAAAAAQTAKAAATAPPLPRPLPGVKQGFWRDPFR